MYLGALLVTVLMGSAHGGEVCAAEDILRQFIGRVEEVENLGRSEPPPEAIRTHRDARWLVTIKLVKPTCNAAGVLVPPRLLYAVHSPLKIFRVEGKAAIGKVFLFVERRPRNASGQSQLSRIEALSPRAFDAAPGWQRLRWGMSDAEVRQELGRMRLAFTEEEMSGMFEEPATHPVSGEPARAAGPKHVCAIFTRLGFDLDGGRGEAELLGWQLRSVSIVSAPLPTEARVEAYLLRLRRRLGEPDESSAPSREPGAVRLLWFNQESRLEVTTTLLEGKWVVRESYQRMPVGWP